MKIIEIQEKDKEMGEIKDKVKEGEEKRAVACVREINPR